MPRQNHPNDADKQRRSSGASSTKFKPGNPHRFKPGQSGNPNGRPKYRTITESLRALLEKTEKRGGPTVAEILSAVMIKKAKGGHVQAFEAVANRAEGKPTQPVDLTGNVVIENAESRREWAEKRVAELMESHKLTREAALSRLKASGATKLLELLGEL